MVVLMYADLKTNRRLKIFLLTSVALALLLLQPGPDTPGGLKNLFARHGAHIILNDVSPSPVAASTEHHTRRRSSSCQAFPGTAFSTDGCTFLGAV